MSPRRDDPISEGDIVRVRGLDGVEHEAIADGGVENGEVCGPLHHQGPRNAGPREVRHEGAQRMVNADRDKSEPPHVHDWVTCQNVTTTGHIVSTYEVCQCGSARLVDAGTPTGAPAPSQAATEAHSDENEALRSERVARIANDSIRSMELKSERKRAEAAEAKVARVEALCDDWDRVVTAESIRAALAGPAIEEGKPDGI